MSTTTQAPRPAIRLISAASTDPKAKIPTMKTPPDTEDEKVARIKTLIKEAVAGSTRSDPGPARRRRAAERLEDHVLKVRNALAAVCVLAQSTQSACWRNRRKSTANTRTANSTPCSTWGETTSSTSWKSSAIACRPLWNSTADSPKPARCPPKPNALRAP